MIIGTPGKPAARIRVDLDGRVFYVKLDEVGAVRGIVERKTGTAGFATAYLYDAPYWHHSHRRPKRGMVARIFEEIERRQG